MPWPFRTPYPVLREASVSLKGSEALIEGTVWAQRGGYLVLKRARLLKRGDNPVPMDGEVVIPIANIEFMQLVG